MVTKDFSEGTLATCNVCYTKFRLEKARSGYAAAECNGAHRLVQFAMCPAGHFDRHWVYDGDNDSETGKVRVMFTTSHRGREIKGVRGTDPDYPYEVYIDGNYSGCAENLDELEDLGDYLINRINREK